MPEMTVAMGGPHFGADHAEGSIFDFLHMGGLDRLGKTRPAFIFVRTKIDMLVLFSQPRGILVDNLTMTSDLADTLIREPGVR